MAQLKAHPGGAKSDGVITPITPGWMERVTAAVRYTLTGKRPDDWFGPSQPIAPQAQDQALGRQWDYPVGYNLRWTPRADEAISFDQLRSLADGLDILRLAIETRKDQLCRMDWVIRPVDEEADPDERCDALQQQLAMPDREHDFQTWLRMVLEDVFVIDAATIYPRMTRGGQVYSLDVIDGSTINRKINSDGRTPEPPDVAYQQILKGVPAVDYHRDELLYIPRNVRAHKLYGYSPVEQIVMTVNLAMRRQLGQLAYFTDGSTPDLIFAVPETWTADQIKSFKAYWDGLLSGNLQARRGTMFVPNGVKVTDTKERLIKDEFDEWLTRIVCYAFSLPPTAFNKAVPRATAGVSQDAALEEGLAPIMTWVEAKLSFLVQKWFKQPDLEFAFSAPVEVDHMVQAQIDQIYLATKVMTPDEVRQNSLAMDPLTEEQKTELNPPPPAMGADENGKPVPVDHPANVMPKPAASNLPGKPGSPGPAKQKPAQTAGTIASQKAEWAELRRAYRKKKSRRSTATARALPLRVSTSARS